MSKIFKILFFLSSFYFSVKSYFSQDLALYGLNDISIYHNLKEALKHKEDVEGLVLKKGKLKEIPMDKLVLFPNLQYLDLSKNKIDSIPKSIDKLDRLVVLDLSVNKIVRPPEELYNLTQLQCLKLGRNRIDYVSFNIQNLQELIYLDLWSNEFIHLPEEIKNLKELRKMDVRMVSISDKEQAQVKKWLPETNILFSNTCDCD